MESGRHCYAGSISLFHLHGELNRDNDTCRSYSEMQLRLAPCLIVTRLLVYICFKDYTTEFGPGGIRTHNLLVKVYPIKNS